MDLLSVIVGAVVGGLLVFFVLFVIAGRSEPEPEAVVGSVVDESVDEPVVEGEATEVESVMSDAQLADLKARRCMHCGGVHEVACPRVRRFRFRQDGQTVWEVEFWADSEWPKDHVVFIDDEVEKRKASDRVPAIAVSE